MRIILLSVFIGVFLTAGTPTILVEECTLPVERERVVLCDVQTQESTNELTCSDSTTTQLPSLCPQLINATRAFVKRCYTHSDSPLYNAELAAQVTSALNSPEFFPAYTIDKTAYALPEFASFDARRTRYRGLVLTTTGQVFVGTKIFPGKDPRTSIACEDIAFKLHEAHKQNPFAPTSRWAVRNYTRFCSGANSLALDERVN